MSQLFSTRVFIFVLVVLCNINIIRANDYDDGLNVNGNQASLVCI